MLDALFKPKSVAIIGASNNPLSIGHIVIQNLLDHDFKGPIYPINPKSKFIKSFKAYPSISDVPDDIDLVNISIKNSLVPSVIEECGKKGVKFGIIHRKVTMVRKFRLFSFPIILSLILLIINSNMVIFAGDIESSGEKEMMGG